MAQAVTTTHVAQGAEPVEKRTQFPGPQGAGTGDLFFVLGQVGGQAAAAQQGAGARTQFAQVKLFRLAVLVVEVTAGTAKTLGHTDGLKPAGAIAGATGARLIDETLDHQHRMSPLSLPVITEPAQA